MTSNKKQGLLSQLILVLASDLTKQNTTNQLRVRYLCAPHQGHCDAWKRMKQPNPGQEVGHCAVNFGMYYQIDVGSSNVQG